MHGIYAGILANRSRKGAAQLKPEALATWLAGLQLTAPERGRHN